jgi:hypothetical protein
MDWSLTVCLLQLLQSVGRLHLPGSTAYGVHGGLAACADRYSNAARLQRAANTAASFHCTKGRHIPHSYFGHQVPTISCKNNTATLQTATRLTYRGLYMLQLSALISPARSCLLLHASPRLQEGYPRVLLGSALTAPLFTEGALATLL